MAIVTRRYRRTGPQDSDLTTKVSSTASLTTGTTNAVEITIDDAVSGILGTLDQFMEDRGFVFDATAPLVDVPPLASTPPVDVTKAAAVVGVSVDAARADHKHDISTASATEITDSTNSEGSATSVARSDHGHAHGSRGGGSLHALVVPSGAAGFISGADKSKLDGIASGATNTPITATPPVDVTKAAAAVGVSTEAARSDHKHDVSTGTPATGAVAAGNAAAEGAATSLARSDHTHAVAVATPVELADSSSSAGAATTFVRSDHVHAHGNRGGGTLHDLAVASGAAGFMSGADKSKLDGIAPGATATPLASTPPVDVTKAAAVIGVSTTAARADHKHDIATAIAGSVAVGDAAAEGASTSLARADHVHAVAAPGAPADVTKAAASAGASTSPARADHKHDVSTAAPAAGAVAAGNAAAEGAATSLSRSDHTHAVSVAAPVDVGTANAAGAATTFVRSDHVHAHGTQPLGAGTNHAVATPTVSGFMSAADKAKADTYPSNGIANWTGTRFYAVDYDGGSDSNVGFSDVSMSAAGAIALKTLERLRAIFPRTGNGQTAVIAVKARAGGAVYRNAADTADDELQLIGVTGYQDILVRGTGDVATAGAVAFANDTADKIALGAQIFAGTNAAGYNPVAPISASSFDVQLNGGGAPGLAAEPTLLGKRIRFDSATTTVALRNVCRMIHENDTDTITVDANLPATPVAADIFYIEEPATSVNRIQVLGCQGSTQAPLPSFSVTGFTIAGFRMPNTTAGFVAFSARSIAGAFRVSFCDSYSPGFSNCTWGHIFAPTVQSSYLDETSTTITTGVGFSCDGWGGTVTNCSLFIMSSSVSRLGRWQVLNIGGGTISIGTTGGCYFGAGLLTQNCKGSGGTQNTVGGNNIGSNASSTVRRTRMVGGFAGACMSLTHTDAFLRGLRIENVGTLDMIQTRGINANLVINDVVGSTGNTGVGLEMSLNRFCNILMGQLNANTFTGAAGQDIVGAGPVRYVHADYALTDLVDSFGNRIQGTASTNIGSSALVTNDATADIGQYKIVRAATGTGLVRAAQADTAANAAGVVGVSQSAFTAAPAQLSMIVTAGGTWMQFDLAPSVGDIAYLSTATAGNAQVAIPAVAGSNRKLRLGRVLRVSGTRGYVAFFPEILSVVADGAA